jgi:UDP-2,3-diacylglucosamine hydrolase
VDIVSDLHLCEEAPRTVAAFETWLARTDADALLLLGDVFEVWIGDDTRHRPFLWRCLSALREAAARRPVCFMAGNRDFLLGPAAAADAGLQPLPDPWRVDLCGQPLLLSHGDALCLADAPYQAFRRLVRDTAWQRDFLARPVAEREAIAQRIRSESQGRKAAQPDLTAWADTDPDECRRWLQAHGASTLLHGHTHRPGVTALGDGLERRVLTDWDFDSHPPRGHVLRLDADGWHRRAPDGTPA